MRNMYFHQRNTGDRAKTFVGTYLVTKFSYEGAIANRMRYDHFEECFFKLVERLKKLQWKHIFVPVKPKGITAAEKALDDALREDDSLATTEIPKWQRAIDHPKCSDDSLVEFTNKIMAAQRRRKELKSIITDLRATLKSEEDKFQPFHNIDEQFEMLQASPQAEELRLRAKAEIMKIVTRIGLVFGFNREKGKEITATINFADGLVRTIKFYPQKYYAEIDYGKGKPEKVKFDHGHHPAYKLTEDDAREVYRLYDKGNGMCQKEIAPKMGVTRGVIYNILIGKQYPHLYKELNGSPPINIGNRGKHKLGEKEAIEIWKMHLDGMIQAKICKVVGVSGVTLSNILTGKRFHDLYLENKPKPRRNPNLNGAGGPSYWTRIKG